MRPTSAAWNDTVKSSHRIVTTVEAYYNGTKTADIPILSGSITFDAFAEGRRRCQLQVPLRDGGTDYNPRSDPLAPLASNGQRLNIRSGIERADGIVELVNLGWFLISDWAVDEAEGTLSVTGSDLWEMLRVPILANAVSMKIPPNSTRVYRMSNYIPSLVYPRLLRDPFPGTAYPEEQQILPVTRNTAAVPDRTLFFWNKIGVQEGDDRIVLIKRVADSWPADVYVSDSGNLHINKIPDTPTPSTTPAVTLTDGSGDTPVITARNYQSSRSKILSYVRVRAKDPDDGKTVAEASWYWNSGAWSVFGPFGYQAKFLDSTLITTKAEADDAANAILRRSIHYGFTEQVSIAPNPAIELNDVAKVITANGDDFTGLVVGMSVPLTSDGGAMGVTVTNGDAQEIVQSIQEAT